MPNSKSHFITKYGHFHLFLRVNVGITKSMSKKILWRYRKKQSSENAPLMKLVIIGSKGGQW